MWASSLVIVNSSGRPPGFVFVFFFQAVVLRMEGPVLWIVLLTTKDSIVPVAITMSSKVPMFKHYRGDLHKCKQEVLLSLSARTLEPKP